MSEKFDVIVVGAGPAGTSCAYCCAKAGLKVLLIERGEYPGAKNVMGGILYRQQMEEIIPRFWEEAPLERPIIEQRLWLLDEDSVVTTSVKNNEWAQEPYNNFSILRAKFDQWFAGKAVEAGALLINETVVKECIVEDGKVVGVRTDRPDGEVYANVVVLADGVNSLLAKQLGLRGKMRPDQVALTVMEVINLPKNVINDRFNVNDGEGVAIEMFGDATKGNLGTSFIYTNKESINIGVGTTLSGLMKLKMKPHDLLEYVKQHPMVQPLIRDGESVEYLAHLIPEGGYHAMPQMFADGVLVAGDAAQFVNGIHREGSNMAMTSGKLAAETIQLAHERDDFTKATLYKYRDKILNSFIGKDLEKYKDAAHTFETNPQYFQQYIPLMNRAVSSFFTVDGVPKRQKQANMLEMLTAERGKLGTIKDMYRAWKVMK
ncbi:FAD-dependent oxidoreductase [Bacillus tianshenii]|nr:FAD-dependent oxidoreductase [Bacillus tianshenii]